LLAAALAGALFWTTGCGNPSESPGHPGTATPAPTPPAPGNVLAGAKYTILDTRTDNFDYARAKANAEDAITAHPDLGCMIGLWAYNIPACLEAVKSAGKTGRIKLVSFDERDEVLQGIIDGPVHGTISQQPYLYGYHSVRILKGLVTGDNSVLPKDRFLEVPIVEVRQANASEFWTNLKKLQASGQPAGGGAAPKGGPKLAYITNGIDPFWNNAAAGVHAAMKEFGVNCEVLMPAKGIVDQKRMIETLLAQGVDGMALSPIDARNQVDLINEACGRCKVITHDSDAPDSKRLCFVGMDNYKAGRAAGRMVKEALPGGGKVMLFVGRLEQLNSRQRRQGIIDELLDRPAQSLQDVKFD